MLPKCFQHIDCTTRSADTLDHCYSNFRDANKDLPRPPVGKSDHDAILLLPSYRQKLKQDVPVTRTLVRPIGSPLQECFDHADWNMFRSASEKNIDLNADSVSALIKKCIGDVVPAVTITLLHL